MANITDCSLQCNSNLLVACEYLCGDHFAFNQSFDFRDMEIFDKSFCFRYSHVDVLHSIHIHLIYAWTVDLSSLALSNRTIRSIVFGSGLNLHPSFDRIR